MGAGSSTKGAIASVTVAAQPEDHALGWRLQGWLHASDLTNHFVSVAADRSSTTPVNNQYATPALGFGLNAAVQGRAGDLTYETGVDFRQTEGDDNEQFRNLGAGFTRSRVAGGRTLVAGLYGEASYVTGPWVLTGGARLDGWRSSNGHRTETDLATGKVTFQDNPANRDGLVPTGRLGLRRDLGGGVAWRAAGYAGFRPPTLNELYRPFRVGNDITEANAALKPERLFGVETGLSGDEGALRWNATVFLNTLKDPITNVTVGAGPGVVPGFPGAGFVPAGGVLRQRQNAGRIDAWGLEADTSYALDSRLNLRAAVAYTRAKVDGGTVAPQLTGLRPAQTPRLTLTAGADWRVTDRLGLSGDLHYESARFEDDQNVRQPRLGRHRERPRGLARRERGQPLRGGGQPHRRRRADRRHRRRDRQLRRPAHLAHRGELPALEARQTGRPALVIAWRRADGGGSGFGGGARPSGRRRSACMKFVSLLAGLVLAVGAATSACASTDSGLAIRDPALKAAKTLTVTSPKIAPGGAIPAVYSGYDKSVSPPLHWGKGPYGAKSFALIIEDPDAPLPQPFIHWMAYAIPADVQGFAEGAVPDGVRQGKLPFIGKEGYFGPRPPAGGPHHYHFQVFALDADLGLAAGADRASLVGAMKGHVLASGELVGTFQKP